jgi:hypothetical protein
MECPYKYGREHSFLVSMEFIRKRKIMLFAGHIKKELVFVFLMF